MLEEILHVVFGPPGAVAAFVLLDSVGKEEQKHQGEDRGESNHAESITQVDSSPSKLTSAKKLNSANGHSKSGQSKTRASQNEKLTGSKGGKAKAGQRSKK